MEGGGHLWNVEGDKSNNGNNMPVTMLTYTHTDNIVSGTRTYWLTGSDNQEPETQKHGDIQTQSRAKRVESDVFLWGS